MIVRRPPDLILAVVLLSAALAFAACGEARNGDAAGDEVVESPPMNNGPAIFDPEGLDENAGLPAPAPEFEVVTLEGSRFSLEAHRGQVILLNFWATWCGPCIVEIPDLQELHETYGARGLAILGVSVEDGEDDLVRSFAGEMGMTYNVAVSHALADHFGGVYGLPTTFVIDKNGQIVERVIGLFPTQEMIPRIEELLGEEAV